MQYARYTIISVVHSAFSIYHLFVFFIVEHYLLSACYLLGPEGTVIEADGLSLTELTS